MFAQKFGLDDTSQRRLSRHPAKVRVLGTALSTFVRRLVVLALIAQFEIQLDMPQLIVRQIEEKVVRKLKERAGQHGVSMEEEHRRILRDALLETSKKKRSFKDYLLSMPNVGEDKDFERGPQIDRPVDL